MRAAVIDVGSNSIKLLVADRAADGGISEVLSRTLEVRISAGIGSDRPALGADGIERGLASILRLAAEALGLGADRLSAVATSAVRDASNGAEFQSRVKAEAGLDLRILSGIEEANLIGRGLTTEPALAATADFQVFDLGGGSLECLSFEHRAVAHATSLPLGCVRLTEKFVADPAAPLSGEAARNIRDHVTRLLLGSPFPFPVPPGVRIVGTGGTLTTVRAMSGAEKAVPLAQTDALVPVSRLRELSAAMDPLDLASRRRIPGLPPSRADVFPAALATLVALAEVGGIGAFQHSLRNLRWGVASELLD